MRALKAAWAERLGRLEGAGGADAPDASLPDRPVLQGVKILLFMGKGNNGGDAAALARLALREGAETLLCHLHPLPKATYSFVMLLAGLDLPLERVVNF